MAWDNSLSCASGPSAIEKKHRRARMLGWWYVCIGGGFILLAIRSALRGDTIWSVVFDW